MRKCPKCGKELECNPTGPCWCKDLPSLKAAELEALGAGPDQGCLCRNCLQEQIEKRKADGEVYRKRVQDAGATFHGIQPGLDEDLVLFKFRGIEMGMRKSRMIDAAVIRSYINEKLVAFGFTVL